MGAPGTTPGPWEVRHSTISWWIEAPTDLSRQMVGGALPADTWHMTKEERRKCRAILDGSQAAASPDMYDALESVMVGGNHLASILLDKVGPDFAERFPPDMEPQDALRILCATTEYNVWSCWREIMLARAALAKARGQ